MKRTTFLTLAVAASLPLAATRRALARERIVAARRLGRADRSIALGRPGACAARRAPGDAFAGYTLADVR